MLTLFQGPPAWGSPNLSPFCAKLETYLRMAEIPYAVGKPDLRKAPKGKVPYVELDGALIGDSSHIIDVLKARFGDPLDGALTARQRAEGRLVQRTLEEATYFVELYNRWATDNYPVVRDTLFGGLGMSRAVSLMVGPVVQHATRRSLYGQGTSRHTRDEIFEAGRADFLAVAELVSGGPFLFGEKPSSFDAVIFAFTKAAYRTPFAVPYGPCPPPLARHEKTIQSRYFPELH